MSGEVTLPDPGQPRLSVADATGPLRGVALVLHGGRATSRTPVRSRHLAVLRMRPFASSLRRHAGEGLAVAGLQYRVRGWNGSDRSPVPDTLWALDQLAERFPGVPIALVGHSMGARAAIHAAGHAAVRSVVALAPWIDGDDVAALAGRRVLIAHGDADRTTDPRASAAFARRAEQVAAAVSYVRVVGERHAMMRRAAVWHGLATGFVVGTILGETPSRSVRADTAKVVAQALAGQPTLAV